MIKGLKFAFLLCLMLSSVAQSAVGVRHIEQAGGFSFQAPEGWTFRNIPGMKYQFAFGPPANSFAPNINVVDESYTGSLQNYVDGSVGTLKKMFVELSILNRHPFVTNSGLKGEVLVTHSMQQQTMLRQSFFFLPGSDGKFFVVTCSALADGGASLDNMFAESVKTFELLKQ